MWAEMNIQNTYKTIGKSIFKSITHVMHELNHRINSVLISNKRELKTKKFILKNGMKKIIHFGNSAFN
jgi:hypothetical protein